MPRRLISTQLTPLYKLVMPVFFGILLVVFGLVAFMFYRSGNLYSDNISTFYIFVAAAIIVFGVAIFTIWHLGLKLKKVEIDEYYLYVSDFIKTVRIPLTEIKDVEEWKYFNPVPIWVHFRNETRFGKSIIFYASYRWFPFYTSHPTFQLLKSLVLR